MIYVTKVFRLHILKIKLYIINVVHINPFDTTKIVCCRVFSKLVYPLNFLFMNNDLY